MKAEQPELIQLTPTATTITATGLEFGPTVQRLRDMGAVILGFSAKGATYRIRVLLPPGVMLETGELEE